MSCSARAIKWHNKLPWLERPLHDRPSRGCFKATLCRTYDPTICRIQRTHTASRPRRLRCTQPRFLRYSHPRLPSIETHAHPDLRAFGNPFANATLSSSRPERCPCVGGASQHPASESAFGRAAGTLHGWHCSTQQHMAGKRHDRRGSRGAQINMAFARMVCRPRRHAMSVCRPLTLLKRYHPLAYRRI